MLTTREYRQLTYLPDDTQGHWWQLRTARYIVSFSAIRSPRDSWQHVSLTAHSYSRHVLPSHSHFIPACPDSQYTIGGRCWHHTADDDQAAAILAARTACGPSSDVFWNRLHNWAVYLKHDSSDLPPRDGLTAVTTQNGYGVHATITMDTPDRRSATGGTWSYSVETLCRKAVRDLYGYPGNLGYVDCPRCLDHDEWKAAFHAG